MRREQDFMGKSCGGMNSRCLGRYGTLYIECHHKDYGVLLGEVVAISVGGRSVHREMACPG